MGRPTNLQVTNGRSTMSERLADAAMLVIARDGHDSLSVRRVAREVGVTGGTVQHHYPTKVDLTVGALDRCITRQAHRLLRADHTRGPVERMSGALSSLLPFDHDRRVEAVVWIAMSAAVSGQPEVEARHRGATDDMHRWLTRSIERAQAAGDVTVEVDASEAALMIEAGLDGMMLAGIGESYAWNRRARERLTVLVDRILLQ